MDNPSTDKTGRELSAQRFQMLEDIAKELAGDVTFPTHFDVAMRLRKVLNDPDQTIQQIVTVIHADPLISSKLLQLANSVAYNPGDNPVRDVTGAVNRLGLKTVRSTAIAVAMKQLLLSKEMAGFGEVTRDLWEHTLMAASACHVVARRLSRISPDEAMLAGLVHDLGAFYMLYRAAHYEELRLRPDTVKYLIVNWHESIGYTLLGALGLPEEIVESTRDHDQPRPTPPAPRTLADIVYIGNALAGGHFEWLDRDSQSADKGRTDLGSPYLDLMEEINTRAEEIRAVFS